MYNRTVQLILTASMENAVGLLIDYTNLYFAYLTIFIIIIDMIIIM